MVEGQRLLVVDDEEAICEGCRRIFARQGFQVEKANDAQRGLNMAAENDYAAILLDIKMPAMSGIEFLEQLRSRKPDVPVVLMTGYPSVPNAISAIRLGAAGYVTKPFTPEEISQAVQKHLRHHPPATGDSNGDSIPPEPWVPAAEGFYFWHNSWVQPGEDGTARVGAMVPKSLAAEARSMRLPKVGEVVYQGLPLAALEREAQPPQIIASPLSGIVIAVNSRWKQKALDEGLAGNDWIALISPTRLEEEINNCTRRRVILLNGKPATAKQQQAQLAALGCQVRVVSRYEELAPLTGERYGAVFLDADAFGVEGPKLVARINAAAPETKIVVLAQADSPLEPAYRTKRIFYYAVEPFADHEIVEILQSVFASPEAPPAKRDSAKGAAAPIATLHVVNRNGAKVCLMPAPDLLQRDSGLGRLIRQRLLARLLPVETLLGESPITPTHIMKIGAACDRVVVLMARDMGRLPGTLVRDTKSEFISVAGQEVGNVTALVIQPVSPDAGLTGLGDRELEALADHIVNDLVSY